MQTKFVSSSSRFSEATATFFTMSAIRQSYSQGILFLSEAFLRQSWRNPRRTAHDLAAQRK